MPIAYPAGLPAVLASKRTSKIAPFSMAQPRRGTPYVERTGTDTPTIFEVEWLLQQDEAVALRDWVETALQGGVLEFGMPLRTEDGLRFVTGNFMPDGLLDRSREGTLWRYRATIVSRNGRGGEPPIVTFWNPGDQVTTGTPMVLTAENRTAQSVSSPAASRSIRASNFKSAGKLYFEVSIVGGSSINASTPAVGLVRDSTALSGSMGFPNSLGSVFVSGDGTLITSTDTPYGTPLVNATVMVAWDATLGRLWFGANGTWFASGNPGANLTPGATGVLGSYAAVFGASNAFGITATGRWRADHLTYAPPAGFSPWELPAF